MQPSESAKNWILRITDQDRYFPQYLTDAIALFNAALETVPTEFRQWTQFDLTAGSQGRGRPATIGISCEPPGEAPIRFPPQASRIWCVRVDGSGNFESASGSEDREALRSRIPAWHRDSQYVSVLQIMDLGSPFPKPLPEAIAMFQAALRSVPSEFRQRSVFNLYGYSEPGRDHPTIDIAYWRARTAEEQEQFALMKQAQERRAAITALIYQPTDRAIQSLRPILLHGSRSDAAQAAHAIAQLPPTADVIDALKLGFQHPNERVRWQTLLELANIARKLGESGARAPKLQDFLADEDKYLQHWRNWAPPGS